ncbi:MAG: M28 family peptidase [Flavobacteriales bacterium]|nr:M28 family peptidase [Flavobacteriales bacterium]
MKSLIYQLACWGFLLLNSSNAQDIGYARTVLDTLCSPSMHGRGYVKNGDQIASDFIVSEFKRIGLKPVDRRYFQPFSFPVNTFPGKMHLALDDRPMKPGEEFIISAGSPGIKGTYDVVNCSEDDMLEKDKFIKLVKNAKGKFIVVSPSKRVMIPDETNTINEWKAFLIYADENPAAGTIFITYEKLTWDASTKLLTKPSFIVSADSSFGEIKTITTEVENKYLKKYTSRNVIGMITGSEKADSFLVFTAHYDHLGRMGEETYFPGANDNASGIAMLLNLAKHYSENPPRFSMLFIAFSGEEAGLVGSKHYTEHPVIPLQKIRFLLNFDISGTGDEGIQVVNGSVFKPSFDRLTSMNLEMQTLQQVKIRGTACNSDHCPFYEKDVPCFFIYTLGGIKAYHDVWDRSQTLPFTEFENYFRLMVAFINGF